MTFNHLKTSWQKSLKLNSSFEILTQPFQLDFTRFFIWLLICAVILSVTGLTAGLTGNYYGQELEKDRILFRFVQLFSLNLEANIPSWYSGFLMIIVAALNYLIYKFERRVIKKYFLVISALFISMSIDEIASVHEILNNPVRNSLSLGGFLYWSWIVPGIIVSLFIGLYFLKFFSMIERKYTILFLLSGFIYLSGAVGFEMIGGWLYSNKLGNSILYVFEVVIEESLEMFGMLLFIYALIKYIKSFAETVQVIFN